MEPAAVNAFTVIAALGSVGSIVVLMVISGRWSGTLDAKASSLEKALQVGMDKIDARLESHARRLDSHHEQITLLRGIAEGRRMERESRGRITDPREGE